MTIVDGESFQNRAGIFAVLKIESAMIFFLRTLAVNDTVFRTIFWYQRNCFSIKPDIVIPFTRIRSICNKNCIPLNSCVDSALNGGLIIGHMDNSTHHHRMSYIEQYPQTWMNSIHNVVSPKISSSFQTGCITCG